MCSPTNVGKVGQIATFFLAANIIIFITAFLNNSLILVAINKESSLHSPSKLLYCCLATSNLLVGLVIQPLCYLLLFRVLMLTMAAISADRLGAEIQTNCNVKVHVYHYSYLLDSIHSCFIILYFWNTSFV